MNKRISLIIWITAICVVMIAAYTFYSKNKQQSFLAEPPAGAISQSAQSGNPMAPDFDLKDLNGNSVKLSDYKGKFVILNFWAVWCKYCKQEMPDLNELNKELEKDNEAVILAVDVQESADIVKNYLSSDKIDLKVLLDQDGSVTQTYGVTGFPTTFIINKDGSLYTYIPSATTKETLKEILDKMKKGEPVR